MSLGLHLAVIQGGCAMPSIAARPTNAPINPLISNVGLSKDIHSGNPHSDGLHAMKEYSLINHIESLKAVANGSIPLIKSSLDGAGDIAVNSVKPIHAFALSCHQSFPQIASLSYVSDHPELAHTQARPLSSKWATDPDSVPGNLRRDSEGKQISLTSEEILSRISSSMAKRNENEGDDKDEAAKKVSSKQRRKSAKSVKRKQHKNKESNKLLIQGGVEERHSGPSSRSTLKDNEKKTNFHYSPLADIASITALCKGIKIQEKQPYSSISVKQTPYARKTSTSNSPHNNKNVSPFRASLETAMAEYAKKQYGSVSHSNHRRKVSSIDEESAKATKKIFLSETQSGVISDCGACVPCAPPATPTPDQLKRYEYVPSLQDIRSQRSFRQRLQLMETRALKKEKKKQVDCMKMEKMSMREKRLEMKKKQRNEIYALNKLMTDLENERFKQFMLHAGSNL